MRITQRARGATKRAPTKTHETTPIKFWDLGFVIIREISWIVRIGFAA